MIEERHDHPPVVDPGSTAAEREVPPAAHDEGVYLLPVSFGQERYWRLDRMQPGNPTWSVPVRFRLQGPLRPELIERGFNEIIHRHESLRTIFTVVDGQPAQVIRPALEIRVPVTDLHNLPKTERDAQVDTISFAEARRGFDLAIGPLFRASLLRTEEEEHVLLVTPHHSVADYLSIGLISNELGALYEAYSRGTEPALPQLPVQYGDFAVWQREQSQSPVVQKDLAYWKEQLKDLPLLDVSTDRPRPAAPTYDATITSLLLPTQLTDALREIANQEGATFFNTMLAALSVLLQQYTNQTNFGVATQVAGRDKVELEPLIGVFINTVILRMNLSGDPTFPELMRRVQETGLQALAHQNARFEQVLQELRPADYPSHHTLFRLNFICQRDPVKPLEFAGNRLTVIPSKSQGALYDLNVFFVLRNEGWRLACEYSTGLYDAATITRLLNDYRALLEELAKNPHQKISGIPLAEGSAARRKLQAASGPQAGQDAPSSSKKDPPAQSLGAAAAFEISTSKPATPRPPNSSAGQPPEGEAYAMPASRAQERFWTLEELVPGNPALHMRACVRLEGELSLDALRISLQALVDRHETLRTTFERSSGELLQIIRASRTVDLPVSSLEDEPTESRDARLKQALRDEASAPFDLVKGPLTRARLFRLAPEQHVLILTTHHILTDGWSQNVMQRDLWTFYECQLNGREPVLPPLAVQYGDFIHWQREWLASDRAQQELAFWKQQLNPPLPVLGLPFEKPSPEEPAAGPMESLLLPEDLIRSLKDSCRVENVTLFMAFLAAYAATLHRYTNQDDLLIGSPVANRRVETEQLIGPFAGPVILRLNLAGNPTFLELLGRIRDVTMDALSHTEMPFEVLLDHLGVRSVRGRNPLSQCYFFYQNAFLKPRTVPGLTVTPLPDFGLGTHFELQLGMLERSEGIRAQLEYNPHLFEAQSIRRILEDLQTALRLFQEDPGRRIENLPFSAGSEPSQASTKESVPISVVEPPENPTEQQLVAIWEQVLRVRPIGRRANYFELGGTSLLAVRLLDSIERALKIRLPLSTLFEAPTISQMADLLRRKDWKPSWQSLVPIRPAGFRAPLFLMHGHGGAVLEFFALASLLDDDQPVYALQARGLDGNILRGQSVQDLAAMYLKEMRALQPHGPYYLAGFCFGGVIALEAAQQLTALGEKVALLMMIQTMHPAVQRFKPGISLIQRCYYRGAKQIDLELQNLSHRGGHYIVERARRVWDVLRARTEIAFDGVFRKGQPARAKLSVPYISESIARENDRAFARYCPQPYQGDAVLFRAEKQLGGLAASYDLGWRSVIGGQFEVCDVPGHQRNMLLEPHVTRLAQEFNEHLLAAQQKWGTAGPVSSLENRDVAPPLFRSHDNAGNPGSPAHDQDLLSKN